MIRKKGEEISKPLNLKEFLEREKAETFIAAPMSGNQVEIDRKQLLEQIATLERDNKVMAALNDGFPPEIIRLERQIAALKKRIERARKSVPADYLLRTAQAVNELREQIATLKAENKRLKEMMSVMPESFWEAQAAIGKEEWK